MKQPKRNRIKFEYDRDIDAAYLSLSSGRIEESDQVKPGIIVDFDASGGIVGVEILHFAQRFISRHQSKALAPIRGHALKKSA